MLSRALILAAVTSMLCGIGTAGAVENLEAGKPPSAIFSSTCSLCHKSPRGLLKTVAPGSLPGFLRQHYTTSTDMAGAMSAYVLSNGAANAALPGGNLTKQGEESKSAPKPDTASREGTKDGMKGRKPVREASRPDADGLESVPTNPESASEDNKPADASRQGAKQKGAKGKPPKPEVAVAPPREEIVRPDPVPAVTPAPQGNETPAAPQGPKSVAELPTGPLTIDLGTPAPSTVTTEPAGPPRVPISQ